MHSDTHTIHFSRPGPLRAGNDYQDIVAIGYILDWMEEPDRFLAIELEAEESGCLDDVKIYHSDGSLELVQVKFSVNPDSVDDPWDWDSLLATRPSRKAGQTLPSLIERWVQSWDSVRSRHPNVRVRIASNRQSGGNFRESIKGERVLWDKIDDESKRKLTDRLTESPARDFFEVCEFGLGQDGLDSYSKHQRTRFTRLGGTEIGWLSINEAVGRWAIDKNKPTVGGLIRLDHIHDAARWAIPVSLNQRFEVPADFLKPDETFVELLLARLDDPAHPCQFIAGYPASGKSTFVSWFFDRLEELNIPVIRHHYFLSLSEQSYHRLDCEVAAESLLADLRRHHRQALGNRFSENPDPKNLRRALEAVGSYYLSKGKRFIVIVDGLDHVWRERRSIDQLSQLLDMILPCPGGVSLLLVSQPVSNDQLPSTLGNFAPRNAWLKMPKIGTNQVEQWLDHHASEMPAAYRSDTNPYHRDQLVHALLSHCDGQPLHLRYSWNYLVQRRIPMSADEIKKLPACPDGDIRNYYQKLWHGLSSSARTCLMLLALCEWPWPTGGMVEALVAAGESPSDAQQGFEEIRHLLRACRLGVEPYHQSLATAIRDRQETATMRSVLLKASIGWLESEAPEHWRWAHAWELRATLGDVEPLIAGPTREWTVNSLVDFKSRHDRSRILERASWEAASKSRWPRVIEIGTWSEYSERPGRDGDASLEDALEARLHLSGTKFLLLRFLDQIDTLPDSWLPIIGRFLRQAELPNESNTLLQSLRLRYAEAEERPGMMGRRDDAIDRIGNKLASVLPEEVLARWLTKQLESHEERPLLDALQELAYGCREAASMAHFRLLVDASRTAPKALRKRMIRSMARWTTRIALDFGIGMDLASSDSTLMDPLGALIHFDSKREPGRASFQCIRPSLALLSRRHSFDNRNHYTAEIVVDYFWWAMGCRKFGGIESTGEELASTELTSWLETLLRGFIQVSSKAASFLPHDPLALLPVLAEHLRTLRFPEMSAADDDYYTSRGGRRALVLIVHDICCMARTRAPSFKASAEHIKWLFELPFSWLDTTMAAFSQIKGHWLSIDACDAIHEQVLLSVVNVDHYPSKAARASMTAVVMARNGSHEHANYWLRTWAEHLLAHGDHKDMPLIEAVDCVQLLAAESAIPQERHLERLLQLAAASSAVHDFTDGKETKVVPGMFIRGLASIDPSLTWLRRYHRWSLEQQEYYRMEQCLATFVEHADLSHPANIVVAATVSSNDDLQALRERQNAKHTGASEALGIIEAVYGVADINAAKEDGSADERRTAQTSMQDKFETTLADLQEWPPAKLLSMLAQKRDDLYPDQRDKLLSQWYEHWQHGSPSELKQALAEAKLHDPSLKIGRSLWQISLRAPDLIDRLDALATWMRDAGGWSRYWHDKKEAEAVITALANFAPERVVDFITRSLGIQAGSTPNRLHLGHFAWYRLTQLYLKIGQVEQVEAIVDQVVASARELCEVQALPPVNWTSDGLPDFGDPWLFAVDQLSAPELIARERAATLIGRALANRGADAEEALKRWLEFQSIPTLTTQGLLPLLKAAELGRVWLPSELRAIFDRVKSKSIGAWIVARCLNRDVAGRMSEWVVIEETADAIIPNEESSFLKECCYFVPFKFRDLVVTLPEPVAALFAAHWHKEFTAIWGEEPDRRSDPGLHAWWKIDTSGRRHIGAQPWINEACRSGFDRSVARMVKLGAMTDEQAVSWCRRNVPVDLELWKITPRSKPEWWPKVATVGADGIAEVPTELWDSVARWFEENHPNQSSDEWVLGATKGCVDAGAVRFGVNIYPALQRRVDGPKPADEAIVHAASGDLQGVWMQSLRPNENIIQSKGETSRLSPMDCAARLEGWAVLPLTTWLETRVVSSWQAWRMLSMPRTLLNWFGKERCNVRAENNELVTVCNNQVLARWSDWTAGVSSWIDYENGINRVGDVFWLRREWLESLLNEFEGNWIWATTITAHVSGRYGGDTKKVRFHRVFGGSEIIV